MKNPTVHITDTEQSAIFRKLCEKADLSDLTFALSVLQDRFAEALRVNKELSQ